MSTTIRQVRFEALGGPEVLQVRSARLPEPGPGEVTLRILAIGVTQGDAMYRRGTYLEKPSFPSGIGTEVCGRIEACGPGVQSFAVGDRVSSISTFSINRYPAYGEMANLPVTALLRTPGELSDTEGAAYPLAYIPMYLALMREAAVKPGQWVGLTAAAATTSLAACQIARSAGAHVIGIVRNAAKAAKIRDFGFDAVFVDDAALEDNVRAASGGGLDIMLDPVLGPGSVNLGNLLKHRGHIIHYGALAGPNAVHSIYNLAPKFMRVSGFTIYGYSGSDHMGLKRDEAAMAEAEAYVDRGVSAGTLRPLIAQTFGLEDVAAAHHALETADHVGKLVIVP